MDVQATVLCIKGTLHNKITNSAVISVLGYRARPGRKVTMLAPLRSNQHLSPSTIRLCVHQHNIHLADTTLTRLIVPSTVHVQGKRRTNRLYTLDSYSNNTYLGTLMYFFENPAKFHLSRLILPYCVGRAPFIRQRGSRYSNNTSRYAPT